MSEGQKVLILRRCQECDSLTTLTETVIVEEFDTTFGRWIQRERQMCRTCLNRVEGMA